MSMFFVGPGAFWWNMNDMFWSLMWLDGIQKLFLHGLWFHGLLHHLLGGWSLRQTFTWNPVVPFLKNYEFSTASSSTSQQKHIKTHMAAGCQGKVILCNGGILSSLDSASLLAESRPDSWLRVWKKIRKGLIFEAHSKDAKRCGFSWGCLNICIKDLFYFFQGGTNFLLTRLFEMLFFSLGARGTTDVVQRFFCSTASPLILTLAKILVRAWIFVVAEGFCKCWVPQSAVENANGLNRDRFRAHKSTHSSWMSTLACVFPTHLLFFLGAFIQKIILTQGKPFACSFFFGCCFLPVLCGHEIYREHKWPLFWLKRACFGGFTFNNKGQLGPR